MGLPFEKTKILSSEVISTVPLSMFEFSFADLNSGVNISPFVPRFLGKDQDILVVRSISNIILVENFCLKRTMYLLISRLNCCNLLVYSQAKLLSKYY